MNEYTVLLAIQVTADSPETAAILAVTTPYDWTNCPVEVLEGIYEAPIVPYSTLVEL